MPKANIQQIFSSSYSEDNFCQLINTYFSFEQYQKASPVSEVNNACMWQLGEVTVGKKEKLPIFAVQVNNDTNIARNRVQLRSLLLNQVQKLGVLGGFAAYYNKNQPQQWRFSFLKLDYELIDGAIKQRSTASKRYTYLLGKDTNIRTATERLTRLSRGSTLNDIEQAFAVEPLNAEFYSKLFKWYENAENRVEYPNDLKEKDHKKMALIRLITRLLFVWFLKQKQLVNPDLFDSAKLLDIIEWGKPSSYYKAILQNLFFATLNQKIKQRSFSKSNSHFVTNIWRYQQSSNTPLFKISDEEIAELFRQTPFLNGGLFECLDRELTEAEKKDYAGRLQKTGIRVDGFSSNKSNPLQVPNALFFNDDDQQLGLINLLEQYQFTVEESTPLDVEVALDPELLGRVFENLLASYNPETGNQARKSSGSFYTPRPIVDYMVDNSLKQYLLQYIGDNGDVKTNLDRLFKAVDDKIDMPIPPPTNSAYTDITELTSLAGNNDQLASFISEHKTSLIRAIANIKIFDPAVGSGAFPMGLLQRVVAVLAELDPNNEQWQQQQLAKLPQLEAIVADLKTADNIKDADAKHKAKEELDSKRAVIELAFANQNHNYARKLYLIENCIFGVDIQVIAITISKLRFFISLAIEQNPNNMADNYGFIPLPNLEFNFVAANSLLQLPSVNTEYMGKKGKLGDDIFQDSFDEVRNQLVEVRHKYFSAKTLKTKKKYRQQDSDLRRELQTTITATRPELVKFANYIANWDPYNPSNSAEWFDPDWMFGVKDGFDIVIGNPPYIQLQKNNSELANKYQGQNYKSFAKSGDIYCLFYERGHQLLAQNGHLCYITSNKWLRTAYGKKLRAYLQKNSQPRLLLDLGPDIFSSATVDTNILLLTKQPQQLEMEAVAVAKDANLTEVTTVPQPVPTVGEIWNILSFDERQLLDKIEKIGIPLKDWNISINYGIKTGCNNAFIIDQATKNSLVTQDPKSAEIIKPILRGKDIERYSANWAGKWLIATLPALNIDIAEYPAIQSYLLSFGKNRLEQTGRKYADGIKARKKTCNKWFEIQDQIRYYQEFTKKKIVYSEIAQTPQFYRDNANFYVANSAYILTGNCLDYLTALLNSTAVTYIFQTFYATGNLGKKGYRYKKGCFKNLPIPQLSQAEQRPFVDLVEQIQAAKQQNPDADISGLDDKIDELVYQLYQLTPAEIAIVKGKVNT